MSFRNISNLAASSQAEAGVGPAYDILWEWNGIDLTQFGDGAGNPDSTYGTPDGTLSVGTVPTGGIDVPSGNVLIYTTGTATSSYEYFKINDLPALPERFIFRARLGPDGGGSNPFMVWGQDATHQVMFTWAVGQSTWDMGNNNSGIYEGGHYLRAGGVSSISSGSIFEVDCMLRDPDTGVDPQMGFWARGPNISSICYGKGGPAWSNFGSWTAIYHSSWQSGGPLAPAIGFTCNGSAQVSWMGELQILGHPWTKEA